MTKATYYVMELTDTQTAILDRMSADPDRYSGKQVGLIQGIEVQQDNSGESMKLNINFTNDSTLILKNEQKTENIVTTTQEMAYIQKDAEKIGSVYINLVHKNNNTQFESITNKHRHTTKTK